MALVWSFRDLVCSHVEAKLTRANSRTPLSLAVNRISPVVIVNRDGVVGIDNRYDLEIRDVRDGEAVRIKLGLATFFWVTRDGEPTAPLSSDEIDAGIELVLRCAHDYLREHLHWLTLYMGIPALIIEPFRSSAVAPGDEPEAPKPKRRRKAAA